MADRTSAAPVTNGKARPEGTTVSSLPAVEATSHLSPEFQTLHLEPPAEIQPPKRNFARQVRMGGAAFIFSSARRWGKREHCARKKYCLSPGYSRRAHDDTSKLFVQRMRSDLATADKVGRVPYIVVGIMGNHHNRPREILVQVTAPESLFKCIRKACKTIRPFPRRFLSLKRVAGFAVYGCIAEKAYHVNIEIDHQTEQILANMFDQYESGEPDYGNRWLDWIQNEFNASDMNPAAGKYALQLLLRWSPMKVICWGLASIAFSLVIGFWYQWRSYPWAGPGDIVGIVQTAWTISSYILTAAGGNGPALRLHLLC